MLTFWQAWWYIYSFKNHFSFCSQYFSPGLLLVYVKWKSKVNYVFEDYLKFAFILLYFLTIYYLYLFGSFEQYLPYLLLETYPLLDIIIILCNQTLAWFLVCQIFLKCHIECSWTVCCHCLLQTAQGYWKCRIKKVCINAVYYTKKWNHTVGFSHILDTQNFQKISFYNVLWRNTQKLDFMPISYYMPKYVWMKNEDI